VGAPPNARAVTRRRVLIARPNEACLRTPYVRRGRLSEPAWSPPGRAVRWPIGLQTLRTTALDARFPRAEQGTRRSGQDALRRVRGGLRGGCVRRSCPTGLLAPAGRLLSFSRLADPNAWRVGLRTPTEPPLIDPFPRGRRLRAWPVRRRRRGHARADNKRDRPGCRRRRGRAMPEQRRWLASAGHRS
jgi:hypothetical protein